jgi:CheY-like chemotaxis protein
MLRDEFILVIDDDPDICESLGELLADHGHRVESAANGLEALELLTGGTPPCMILLDLMMPVMNGWQFVDAKAADPTLAPIPLCLITAAGITQELPGDAVCVWRKPFKVEELLRVVATHC